MMARKTRTQAGSEGAHELDQGRACARLIGRLDEIRPLWDGFVREREMAVKLNVGLETLRLHLRWLVAGGILQCRKERMAVSTRAAQAAAAKAQHARRPTGWDARDDGKSDLMLTGEQRRVIREKRERGAIWCANHLGITDPKARADAIAYWAVPS